MDWIETPYGDVCFHKFQNRPMNMRTKGTPVRRTPARKYTYTGTRATMSARSSARRALDFAPYVTPTGVVPRTPVRYARTAARRIGFTPGVSTGYRRATVDKWATAVATPDSKTLLFDDLTLIPRKVANEINARERDMINCLGFSLRIVLKNKASNECAICRMALVSPIDKNEINTNDLLRSNGDGRAQEFLSTLDASQLMHNPINRDGYVVLWEKSILLGSTAGSTSASTTFARNQNNFISFSTYVKLNRQLRFDGAAATTCADKCFLLFWYDTPDGLGTTVPSQYVNFQRYVVTHWKDPGT